MSIKCLQNATRKCIMRMWKTICSFRFFVLKEKEVSGMNYNKGNYSALDIARYVINFYNNENVPISNLKLQKVLYFIQANFLKINGKNCFNEKIHAWDYGPVVPEIYREFKGFGSNNIPLIKRIYSINANTGVFEEKEFNMDFIENRDKNLIDAVIRMCEPYSAIGLANISHQQIPWKKTYKRGQDNVIPSELIKECFESEEN